MFRVSERLEPYVEYDNGKIIFSEDLPKELESEAKEAEKAYKQAHKNNDLAEY